MESDFYIPSKAVRELLKTALDHNVREALEKLLTREVYLDVVSKKEG